jgi:magnesium transporter
MPTLGFVRRGTGQIDEGLTPAEVARALAEPGAVGWVDVEAATPELGQELEALFGLHPLALEDALNQDTRPKLEEYETFLFVVTRGVDHSSGPGHVEPCPLAAFVNRSVLVTMHPRPLASVASALERLRKHPELLAHGPDRLFHHLLDQVVDRYFPVVEVLEERIEELEDEVFTRPSPDLLSRIFQIRKDVIRLRRNLGPLREVTANLLGGVSFVDEVLRPFFRDVHDHVLRLLEQLDGNREVLSGLLDGYLSQVSNRTNAIMKRLTILAAIGLPFTVISGFFGMNFEVMPWIRSSWGVAAAAMLMVALSAGLFGFFAWRRWL